MARRRKRINWKSQPLGEVPDARLAARLGVSRRAVTTARRKYANVVAARISEAAISKAADVIDGLRICRDERCKWRVGIHAVHAILDPYDSCDSLYSTSYPYKHDRHRKILREIVYAHVPRRCCKPFRALYDDVLQDYGGFTSNSAGVRAVWRAISDLVACSKIVNIGPRANGGYVRSDSPLLKDQDGMACLLENLEDGRPTICS